MIDFHTHILPKMDDGSHDIAQTKQMLKMEYDQGVRQIVSSSHFYAEREFPEKFLERRADRLKQVKEMLQEEEWGKELQIYAGAEVLYYTGMADSEILPQLCIEGTNVLLLELPFCQWDREVYKEVYKILERRGIRIILAHIERYYPYQKKKETLEEILKLPLTIQMNAGELTTFGTRRIAKKMLKIGRPLLLGSDCHNTEQRPPNLREGRAIIAKLAGEETLRDIDRLGEQVLGL